jgi:hypothetical protein
MFLNINDTGTEIHPELIDYIYINFSNIGFNQIYIMGGLVDKNKEKYIKTTEFDYSIQNTLCIDDTELNINIIDWLNTI